MPLVKEVVTGRVDDTPVEIGIAKLSDAGAKDLQDASSSGILGRKEVAVAYSFPFLSRAAGRQRRHARPKQARLSLEVLAERRVLSTSALTWSAGISSPAAQSGPAAVIVHTPTTSDGGRWPAKRAWSAVVR